MQDAFSRMELLVGNTGVKKLSRAKIAVFGLGGAGSQVAESLARCGPCFTGTSHQKSVSVLLQHTFGNTWTSVIILQVRLTH